MSDRAEPAKVRAQVFLYGRCEPEIFVFDIDEAVRERNSSLGII